MAKSFKKDIKEGKETTGSEALFSDQKPQKKRSENWAKKGCKEGEKRFMLIVNEDQINALFNIAYWDRKTKKEALQEALEDYIKKNKRSANKQRPEGK